MKRAHRLRIPGRQPGVRGRRGLRRRVRLPGERPPGVAPQRPREYGPRPAVGVRAAPVAPGVALRPARLQPRGPAVHRAGEARRAAGHVSARSARWPWTAGQPSASRRVIAVRKDGAGSGRTPGPAGTGNRVLLAIRSSRRNCRSGLQPIHRSRGRHRTRRPARRPAPPGAPARPRRGEGPGRPGAGNRDSDGGPSARPTAGAPQASPDGPRRPAGGTPGAPPGERDGSGCREPPCAELRTCGMGTPAENHRCRSGPACARTTGKRPLSGGNDGIPAWDGPDTGESLLEIDAPNYTMPPMGLSMKKLWLSRSSTYQMNTLARQITMSSRSDLPPSGAGIFMPTPCARPGGRS